MPGAAGSSFPRYPRPVQYSLTPLGESLNEALGPLVEWGERHIKRIAAARRRDRERMKEANDE
jgi:DNA-binding HxlR family transcriptional regulator